jgi:hypothetical protein
MTRPWHGRIRELALSAGPVLARLLGVARTPDAIMHRDKGASPRGGLERRADGFTADVIQVGVTFMLVFGRGNAEAFFATAGIEPAVYRRIIAGKFRRLSPGRDPESESVPA